jgi:probable F420-dependent oxidoreductase
MELGLALSNIGRHLTRDATVTLARAAEDLGFDSVWTSEHLVVTPELFDPFGQIFDSLTTLTYVAAVTQRVRLGTSVLILPLHEPVLLAKQAATLHALSGGRLRLGVGVGWLPEEFALVGADFAGRAAVMDRRLEVLRYLLRSPSGTHPEPPAGFEDIPFAPAVDSPLPILVGGHAPPALRRAARSGDGWHGVWLEPAEVPRYVAETRGRSERPDFTISLRVELRLLHDQEAHLVGRQLIGTATQVLDQLRRYEKAGVDELVVDFMDQDHGGVPDLPEMLDQLHRFCRLVARPA